MAASEVRTLLARNGMLEYAPLLIEKGGLTDATELAQATDDDLAALGVVKVFHRSGSSPLVKPPFAPRRRVPPAFRIPS